MDGSAPAHGTALPARHWYRQGQASYATRDVELSARRDAVLRRHELKLDVSDVVSNIQAHDLWVRAPFLYLIK